MTGELQRVTIDDQTWIRWEELDGLRADNAEQAAASQLMPRLEFVALLKRFAAPRMHRSPAPGGYPAHLE